MNLRVADNILSNYFLYRIFDKKSRKNVKIEVYFDGYNINLELNKKTILNAELFHLYFKFKYTLLEAAKRDDINKRLYIEAIYVYYRNCRIDFDTEKYENFCNLYDRSKGKIDFCFSKRYDNGENYFVYKYPEDDQTFAIVTNRLTNIKIDIIHDLRNNFDLCKLINHDRRIKISSIYFEKRGIGYYDTIIDIVNESD